MMWCKNYCTSWIIITNVVICMFICLGFHLLAEFLMVLGVLSFCRILDVTMDELQRNFDSEASDAIKHSSSYARNFLEYCCFRTLALSTQVAGHLSDKAFRRLTFDMMFAWEAPAAADQPIHKVSICHSSFSHPCFAIYARKYWCEQLV